MISLGEPDDKTQFRGMCFLKWFELIQFIKVYSEKPNLTPNNKQKSIKSLIFLFAQTESNHTSPTQLI